MAYYFFENMRNPVQVFRDAGELGKDLAASLKDFEQILVSAGTRDFQSQLQLFQVAFEKRFKAVRTRLSGMSSRLASMANREMFVDTVVLYIEESADLFEEYFKENNIEHLAQSLALLLSSIRYGMIDYHFIGAEEFGIDSLAASRIKKSIIRIIKTLRERTKLTTLINIQIRLEEMLNDKKIFTTKQTATTQLFRDIIYELL
ncbi:hypothetical protein HYX08_00110 [Candidatus Woesearchaeota archaeon]|nr:hypothetical protein [Candidatus Woesearchaeota archaeon]